MDQGENEFCAKYIYDEDSLDFLVKYDRDIQGVYQQLRPNCISTINSQFLLAYTADASVTFQGMFGYRYQSIPKCYGLMDTSAPESLGLNRVQNLPGLSLKGKDVLVGFVDTGIDYRQPVFQKITGTRKESRILGLWDQTKEAFDFTEGRQAVYGYGAEFTKADIDEALRSEDPYGRVPSRDTEGHGTFLASVACGGLYEGEDATFTGIATESDILMVKLKPAKHGLRDFFLIPEGVPCYSEGDIMLGVKYLINKAVELGKPLVICLGLGTNQGDHDGNTNLELYLETISNLRGVCVVTSGGNELGAGGHYQGSNRRDTLSPVETAEIYVEEGERGFCVEIWGNAPGLLRVSVVSPTGERYQSQASYQSNATTTTFLYEGTRLYMANLAVETNSGDPFVFLRFENPSTGIWGIQVEQQGSVLGRGFDIWLPIRQFLSRDTRFASPDPYVTLCGPGNARGVITMAGYNHKDNALYVNSSRGYTRKGRIKPDLVAPAVEVYGAFAGGGQGLFTRRSGTSVASAFGAGAAALLLEWGILRGNNYGINTEIVRQMFIRGAGSVSDVSYPDPSWGWGVLDIYQTFEVMRNI